MKPDSRIPTRNLLTLVAVLLLGSILLSACFLERGGAAVEWTKNALPQNVCPGDNVTLSWHTGRGGCLGGGCPEPWRISIGSDAGLLVPPFESPLSFGSTTAGPVSSDTTFNFSLFEGSTRLADLDPDRAVHVVLPERETIVPASFPGTCSGGPGWGSMDLRVGTFRASMVRLVRACNNNPFWISLSIEFESSFVSISLLESGDCTRDFEASLGGTAVRAWASPLMVPDPTFGADCSPTRQILPDDIDVAFVLTCGGSASEPITSDDEAPETDSDILEILPPTPTPTPAAAPAVPMTMNFNADSYSIIAGTCTRLRWDVKNAEEIRLDGEVVEALAARQVCPTSTATYRLLGKAGDEQLAGMVTIEVTAPQVPPAAPEKLVISNRVCTDQAYTVTLNWIDQADNEDGFRVFRAGDLVATLGPNATTYTDTPPGSGPYTYGVEAFNSAGASARPTVQEEGCIY